jgi:hypothetical protein
MKTSPSAHTEQQLTDVADRFDHWRQTCATHAEPIPQYLCVIFRSSLQEAFPEGHSMSVGEGFFW